MYNSKEKEMQNEAMLCLEIMPSGYTKMWLLNENA